jgi:myosin-1
VFGFEELRERKVWNYATTIQDFFRKVTGGSAMYNIMKSAASRLQGKKERRRLSLERQFRGEYVGLRDNNILASIPEKYGKLLSYSIITKKRRSSFFF